MNQTSFFSEGIPLRIEGDAIFAHSLRVGTIIVDPDEKSSVFIDIRGIRCHELKTQPHHRTARVRRWLERNMASIFPEVRDHLTSQFERRSELPIGVEL